MFFHSLFEVFEIALLHSLFVVFIQPYFENHEKDNFFWMGTNFQLVTAVRRMPLLILMNGCVTTIHPALMVVIQEFFQCALLITSCAQCIEKYRQGDNLVYSVNTYFLTCMVGYKLR